MCADLPIQFIDQHTGEGQLLLEKLGSKWSSRVSSERALGVETIASRVGGSEQIEMYKLLMENVWAMIAEGFSEKVIQIGETSSEDLEWWFRDVMRWRVGVCLFICLLELVWVLRPLFATNPVLCTSPPGLPRSLTAPIFRLPYTTLVVAHYYDLPPASGSRWRVTSLSRLKTCLDGYGNLVPSKCQHLSITFRAFSRRRSIHERRRYVYSSPATWIIVTASQSFPNR